MADKVAVVTGSSSGFGLLISVELARRGFKVVASMRDPARRTRLDEAARAVGMGQRIDVRALDICNTDSMKAFVDGVVRDHGRIDVLVNNAGFAMAGFAEDVPLKDLREQLETNFFGHVAMTKAVIPTMRQQQSGHIIMITSVSGLVGQPVLSSYSCSKFALEGWTEAVRIELKSLGINAVLVEPGAFKTDIWDRNVRISENAMSESSPNKARSQRFSEFVKTKVHKRDAQEVADLVADIAQDPNPRLRYRIGTDAHAQVWLKRLLPWKTYERLVAKAIRID